MPTQLTAWSLLQLICSRIAVVPSKSHPARLICILRTRYLAGHGPMVRVLFETLRNSVRTHRELALEDLALRQ